MMKLNIWMGAKAVIEVLFGIGFVLVPISLMSLFGVNLNPGAAVIARLCGAVFIASSITMWQSRNETPNHKVIRAMVVATVVSNGIGFIATLLACLSGVWNAVGWLPVVLNLAFVLAFAYFLFKKTA